MKASRFISASLCVVLWLAGCASPTRDTITQVSTINALLAGVYDGQMACGHLASYGDLGLGTLDRLDGEMIVLGGKVYQARADGKVYPVPPNVTTPFASVVHFRPQTTLRITQPTDLKGIERKVTEAFPNPNALLAIRITAQVRSATTRSMPAQSKPYPSLAEVAKTQKTFAISPTQATLVGFRLPEFAKAINVPGYHLHLLTADRRSGGHLLDLQVERGTIEVNVCNRLLMILPKDDRALGQVDLSRDRSEELNRVER